MYLEEYEYEGVVILQRYHQGCVTEDSIREVKPKLINEYYGPEEYYCFDIGPGLPIIAKTADCVLKHSLKNITTP